MCRGRGFSRGNLKTKIYKNPKGQFACLFYLSKFGEKLLEKNVALHAT
jgi:hypothetical protein